MNIKFTWANTNYDIDVAQINRVIKTTEKEGKESITIIYDNGTRIHLTGKGCINKWDHEYDQQFLSTNASDASRNFATGS